MQLNQENSSRLEVWKFVRRRSEKQFAVSLFFRCQCLLGSFLVIRRQNIVSVFFGKIFFFIFFLRGSWMKILRFRLKRKRRANAKKLLLLLFIAIFTPSTTAQVCLHATMIFRMQTKTLAQIHRYHVRMTEW